jgi:hypothetical protein
MTKFVVTTFNKAGDVTTHATCKLKRDVVAQLVNATYKERKKKVTEIMKRNGMYHSGDIVLWNDATGFREGFRIK